MVFPEEKGQYCLVSIGIGSSSLGKDGDLASNPGFRRSFMRLIKKGTSDAKFFFKLRFDDMETSTPGLQEELYSTDVTGNNIYEDVIINTSTKYNADSSKEAPGLLPAAFIVDYTTDDGWNLILSWLAQYARWRCWDKFGTGGDKAGKANNINKAISECRVSDTGHGIGDGHGGQAAATIESIASDGGHRIGDGHGGKASAFLESTTSDVGN